MQHRQRLDLIHQNPAYPTVERVLLALNQAGHQAVLAGGCVRDALLNRAPKDFDVATSAKPEDVEALFSTTLAVGKAFGTIVVIENGYNFEVTTFRAEEGYIDGRRPSKVEFTSMEEDAKRRDFTVNAFFYDAQEALIYDFVGGRADLDGRLIRTVGLAQDRFSEDHLRMLRAVRFASQLGFSVERRTSEAILELHEKIRTVSSERVLHEMQRLLAGAHLELGLKGLLESTLYRYIWPELEHLNLDKLRSFMNFMSWENAFAGITCLLDIKPEPRLMAWKASRVSMRKIKAQVDGVQKLLDPKSSRACRILALGGAEFAQTLVLAAGILGLEGRTSQLEKWIAEYLQVAKATGELPAALISGEDLLKLGVPASEQMGRMLKSIYEAQLEGKINSREQAIAMAEKLKS